MLSAPKSAKILEMFPASRVANTYFLLALSLGQTYRSLMGQRGARKEWFDVDVAELDSRLDALLMD